MKAELMGDEIKVYIKSMGKVFRVRFIAKTDAEANDYMSRHNDTGVMAVDKTGLVYICDFYQITVKSDVLPD